MTSTDLVPLHHATRGDDVVEDLAALPVEEQRDRARQMAQAEPGLTGAALAARFGRQERWGRQQLAAARTGTAPARRNGTAPAGKRHAPARPAGTPPAPPAGTAQRTGTARPAGTPQRGGTAADRRPGPAAAGPRRHGARAQRRRSPGDTVITLVVALVAAAASYGHMLDVALMAGEPLWIARAFPVTVDGLVVAALRRGAEGRGWLALGAAVSIAANVLAQFPELAAAAGPVVSAWPPLALYGTHRLLAGRRHRPDPTDT